MPFYNFDQNNSGGYFVKDYDKGVCEYVFIEAENASEAIDKLLKIGEEVDGFHDYCGCCGQRWYYSDVEDSDGTDEPLIYGDPISSIERCMFREECFVHYADGSFKLFRFE